jgi:hypothetical protein
MQWYHGWGSYWHEVVTGDIFIGKLVRDEKSLHTMVATNIRVWQRPPCLMVKPRPLGSLLGPLRLRQVVCCFDQCWGSKGEKCRTLNMTPWSLYVATISRWGREAYYYAPGPITERRHYALGRFPRPRHRPHDDTYAITPNINFSYLLCGLAMGWSNSLLKISPKWFSVWPLGGRMWKPKKCNNPLYWSIFW